MKKTDNKKSINITNYITSTEAINLTGFTYRKMKYHINTGEIKAIKNPKHKNRLLIDKQSLLHFVETHTIIPQKGEIFYHLEGDYAYDYAVSNMADPNSEYPLSPRIVNFTKNTVLKQTVKQHKNNPKTEYLFVRLLKKDGRRVSKFVHKLVDETQNPNYRQNEQTHHITFDTKDNRAESLISVGTEKIYDGITDRPLSEHELLHLYRDNPDAYKSLIENIRKVNGAEKIYKIKHPDFNDDNYYLFITGEAHKQYKETGDFNPIGIVGEAYDKENRIEMFKNRGVAADE